MRNSENFELTLKIANNLADIAGATLPGEIVKWLKILIKNGETNSPNTIENSMEILGEKSQNKKRNELEILVNKFTKHNNGEKPCVIMYCDS